MKLLIGECANYFFGMASKEFEESDLQAAAKALGCEDCLPNNINSDHQALSPKNLSSQDRYVQEAMHGCVSFLPDEPEVEKVSYAYLFKQSPRSKGRLNNWNMGNQPRNLMTGKPGHDKD